MPFLGVGRNGMKTGGENWTGNEDSVRKNKLILDCLSNIFFI